MENPKNIVKKKFLFNHFTEFFSDLYPYDLRRPCNDIADKTDEENYLLEMDKHYEAQEQTEPKYDFGKQLEMLQEILPDADPNYLASGCRKYANKPAELNLFITRLVETGRYPTKKDFLRKQEILYQQRFYTTEFDAEEYLKIIPDPLRFFEDPSRRMGNLKDRDYSYAVCCLSNYFPYIPLTLINKAFRQDGHRVFVTCQRLLKINPKLYPTFRRKPCKASEVPENIQLLQEVAFIEHYDEIERIIKRRKLQEAEELKLAREAAALQTCTCCLNDDVRVTDMYKCENGCHFCKECVRKTAEIEYGNGKLDFSCLAVCPAYFSLNTLQAVLCPKMFLKITQRKQLEELKSAGIEGLEICPFCDYAAIPDEQDRLFECKNPECLQKSCRICKEPAHLPLRCDEIEKQEEVRIRTYIEDKMTEALLRKCCKCGLKFVKSDGCNRMTCACGAAMCYVCGEPILKDRWHFTSESGGKTELCPLYSDTDQLHKDEVLKGAETAKKEKGVDGNVKLKIDPTRDISQHYGESSIRSDGSIFVKMFFRI